MIVVRMLLARTSIYIKELQYFLYLFLYFLFNLYSLYHNDNSFLCLCEFTCNALQLYMAGRYKLFYVVKLDLVRDLKKFTFISSTYYCIATITAIKS